MIVKVKEIRGVTLYVTESDAMPKKAEEAEAPKQSEQYTKIRQHGMTER